MNPEKIKVEEFFKECKLAVPFVPEEFLEKIKEQEHGVFGTRSDNTNLYDLEAFVGEVITKPVNDYIMFGISGHGVASWGMHYYIVKGNLALFLQLGYGGLSMDEKYENDRVNDYLGSLQLLFETIEEAQKNNLIEKNKRLLIVESDFMGSGWAWIQNQPGELTQDIWHSEGPIILNAMMSVPKRR